MAIVGIYVRFLVCTLPAKAPENGWLEDDPFLLGRLGPTTGAFAVSFRECIWFIMGKIVVPLGWYP